MKKLVFLIVVSLMLFIPVFAIFEYPSDINSNILAAKPAGYNYILVTEGLHRPNDEQDYRVYFSEEPFIARSGGDSFESTGNTKEVYWDEYESELFVYDLPASVGWSNLGIVSASHDIKYSDGTVFFSVMSDFLVMMMKIPTLEILTRPIVGLIVSLIGLWIISTGFSKAWQYLSMQLRKG